MGEEGTEYPIVRIDPYAIERPESDPRYQFQRMFFTEETAPPDLWAAAMAAKEVPSGRGGPGGVTKRFRWRRGERPTDARGFEPWAVNRTSSYYADKFFVGVEQSDAYKNRIERADAANASHSLSTLRDYDVTLERFDSIHPSRRHSKQYRADDYPVGDIFGSHYPWFYATEPAFEFIRERAVDDIAWKRVPLPEPRKGAHDLFAIEVIPRPVIDWFSSEVVWQYRNAGYGMDAGVSADLIGEPCFNAEVIEGRTFLRDSDGAVAMFWQFIAGSFAAELTERFSVVRNQRPAWVLHADTPKIYYGED